MLSLKQNEHGQNVLKVHLENEKCFQYDIGLRIVNLFCRTSSNELVESSPTANQLRHGTTPAPHLSLGTSGQLRWSCSDGLEIEEEILSLQLRKSGCRGLTILVMQV